MRSLTTTIGGRPASAQVRTALKISAIASEQPRGYYGAQLDSDAAENQKEAHARFARGLIDKILVSYKAGELDLEQMLGVLDSVAGDVGNKRRTELLGEAAVKARDVGKRRYLGRRRPRYPTWLKDYAVDLLIEHHAGLNALLPTPLLPKRGVLAKDQRLLDSALRWVTVLLAHTRIYPPRKSAAGEWHRLTGVDEDAPTLSADLLHRWYKERMRRDGTQRPRGRPRPSV